MVLEGGLEPPWFTPYGPQPYASANSATRARVKHLLFGQALTILDLLSFSNSFSIFFIFFAPVLIF